MVIFSTQGYFVDYPFVDRTFIVTIKIDRTFVDTPKVDSTFVDGD